MNVSCSKCPARYAVPDAKVRGKKVHMVCRHCGATIAIDGTSLGASVRP
jgi:PHP family Zn ribbon phosphoesterase